MSKKRIAILFALLSGISLFSISQYIYSLKERHDLRYDLNRVKSELAQLRIGNQYLTEELEEKAEIIEELNRQKDLLKGSLRKNQEQLAQLEIKLSSAQRQTAELRSQKDALEQRYSSLEQEKARVAEERSFLQGRLNSFAELRKAIRELKIRMRKERVSRPEIREEAKEQRHDNDSGNQGFITKNGRSTLGAKVMIKVIPVR